VPDRSFVIVAVIAFAAPAQFAIGMLIAGAIAIVFAASSLSIIIVRTLGHEDRRG
jgi:hypothetical protein